jgi:hypothetical protein
MKHILLGLYLCSAVVMAASPPSVEQCFKVNRLLRLDSTHYWADWTNTCRYTIDSVYVMVGFLDHSHKVLGDGVWPMYFVLPGVHRVTRFSVPVGVSAYETVRVNRITSDAAEALRTSKREIDAAEHEVLPPGFVGDTDIGRVTHIAAK